MNSSGGRQSIVKFDLLAIDEALASRFLAISAMRFYVGPHLSKCWLAHLIKNHHFHLAALLLNLMGCLKCHYSREGVPRQHTGRVLHDAQWISAASGDSYCSIVGRPEVSILSRRATPCRRPWDVNSENCVPRTHQLRKTKLNECSIKKIQWHFTRAFLQQSYGRTSLGRSELSLAEIFRRPQNPVQIFARASSLDMDGEETSCSSGCRASQRI